MPFTSRKRRYIIGIQRPSQKKRGNIMPMTTLADLHDDDTGTSSHKTPKCKAAVTGNENGKSNSIFAGIMYAGYTVLL
jgi:hypothetical protein